jgi:hypothetical protein
MNIIFTYWLVTIILIMIQLSQIFLYEDSNGFPDDRFIRRSTAL